MTAPRSRQLDARARACDPDRPASPGRASSPPGRRARARRRPPRTARAGRCVRWRRTASCSRTSRRISWTAGTSRRAGVEQRDARSREAELPAVDDRRECRHPHHLAAGAHGDLDRGGVQPADLEVAADAAEHPQALDRLLHEDGDRAGRVGVALQDDARRDRARRPRAPPPPRPRCARDADRDRGGSACRSRPRPAHRRRDP